MLIRFSGPVAAALAVAVAVTSLNFCPAQAAPSNSDQSQATQSTAATTDFSARRRHYHRGNPAALGAVLGIFGTIAAVAAANQYRDRYYYGYYGDPYYYEPGPYYYGGPYYGGGYFGSPAYGWGGGHRHHHHRR
jgi:hypothetical protein